MTLGCRSFLPQTRLEIMRSQSYLCGMWIDRPFSDSQMRSSSYIGDDVSQPGGKHKILVGR